ncbi:MAG TPA: LCP family protein [Patescibacteria group bacterium]|jgi:LCP family protein required for cell wall assembly|nr:LCP family protein [Patescibacteria group bacterium]
MAKKNTPSMDGFIPRRSIGGRQEVTGDSGLRPSFENSNLSHASDERDLKVSSLAPQQEGGLTRSSIDESLNTIETDDEHAKRQRRLPVNKKKLIKRIVIALAAIFLLIGIILGVKFLMAGGSVFQGNILGLVQSQPLKEDANGRSNIVVFGTSEDDEGGNHPGAYLTDSIMVISLDQKNNDAATFSIPRDLWIKYDKACMSGYEGRINALYDCYSNAGKDEAAGTDALRKALREITGLDVQYYVHVNYGVVRDVVDAVGGVDVDIQSDPKSAGGILDRNFDWKCNYQCYYVKYDNGVHHLDGEHALALARARGDATPTYGLSRSNYDREINQQKIAIALKEKALTAGTLTNFGKISGLLDALGKNLRTNFDTAEIRTLMRLGEDIPTDKIARISLIDADPALFTSDNVNGASVVRSVDGFYSYDNIAQYLQKRLSKDPVVREAAAIGVYNGTTTSGLAQQTADSLKAKYYTVADVGNADRSTYKTNVLYDVSGGKKAGTVAKLESEYGIKASAEKPPFATQGLDIVLILGNAATN